MQKEPESTEALEIQPDQPRITHLSLPPSFRLSPHPEEKKESKST